MIWLTWRQFRAQALVTLAALIALTIYLILLGQNIRHSYNTNILGCLPANCTIAQENFTQNFSTQVSLIGAFLIAIPAIIGIFWGAPLITREFEDGTHRLVWNQSITRTRWLAIKLTLIGLISVATTGLLSLLLTWNASRYDQLKGDRFAALNFASRNIVPLGYAVFAFVLGTITGLLVRRTLLAMALTLAIFTVIQILVPTAIRAHLLPPITSTVKLSTEVMSDASGGEFKPTSATLFHYIAPGTWSLTDKSVLLHADGTPATGRELATCRSDEQNGATDDACLAALDVHFDYTHQPASRYWPFQWIELSAFLVLSALLAGLGFWWIRNRPS